MYEEEIINGLLC